MPAAVNWCSTCAGLPSTQPVGLAWPSASLPKMGLIALDAKMPVSSAPIVPPMPCTPNASSESS